LTDETSGFLLIDKEEGITSHELVEIARKKLKIKKIGHAGTLDPFASGLMILGIGKATRMLEFLLKQDKSYRCTMKLGIITETFDLEGNVKEERDTKNLKENDIIKAFESFKDGYFQTPPAYSAKKYKGERLYKLAREGKIINLPPKKVKIKSLVIDDIDLKNDRVSFLSEVSSGTYIRSLVMDIGYEIGCGAVTEKLRRTKIGDFSIENAIISEEISSEKIISMDKFSKFLPAVMIKNEFNNPVKNGSQVYCHFVKKIIGSFKKEEIIRIVDEDEKLTAIATSERSSRFISTLTNKSSRERIAKLKKVFI